MTRDAEHRHMHIRLATTTRIHLPHFRSDSIFWDCFYSSWAVLHSRSFRTFAAPFRNPSLLALVESAFAPLFTVSVSMVNSPKDMSRCVHTRAGICRTYFMHLALSRISCENGMNDEYGWPAFRLYIIMAFRYKGFSLSPTWAVNVKRPLDDRSDIPMKTHVLGVVVSMFRS